MQKKKGMRITVPQNYFRRSAVVCEKIPWASNTQAALPSLLPLFGSMLAQVVRQQARRLPSVVGTYASPLSSAAFDHEAFTASFLNQLKGVSNATDPVQSAQVLRQLVKSKELMFADMCDAPEKFFLAHRLLATIGLNGFGVRFTVQYNLFAGSIIGLAGPEQLKMLESIQEKGQLGCFLLTEMQAGVLSGLIVETTVDWDEDAQEFILHTPSDKAAKNWISQGYTAELGVVIADLRIKGKSYGPHPFFLHLRDEEGGLLPGIRIEDMGTKTVANDLDNARVWFDQVKMPKNALLNKFADIQDNEYVQTGEEKMRIEVIGQRLLTGRIAIAEAALISSRVLHMRTEEYAKQKICNGLAGETTLSEMPQLKVHTSSRTSSRTISHTPPLIPPLTVNL
jgi:acyl-CoA oxidase